MRSRSILLLLGALLLSSALLEAAAQRDNVIKVDVNTGRRSPPPRGVRRSPPRSVRTSSPSPAVASPSPSPSPAAKPSPSPAPAAKPSPSPVPAAKPSPSPAPAAKPSPAPVPVAQPSPSPLAKSPSPAPVPAPTPTTVTPSSPAANTTTHSPSPSPAAANTTTHSPSPSPAAANTTTHSPSPSPAAANTTAHSPSPSPAAKPSPAPSPSASPSPSPAPKPAPAPVPTTAPRVITSLSVSTGGRFTCALADGEVKCWGQNDYGQLGLGDSEFRGNQPGQLGQALPRVDLGTGVNVTQLSTGTAFSCALVKDASAKPAIKCWGSNSGGQLGQGDTVNRGDEPGSMGDALKPVDLGTGLVPLYVGAGGLHACALLREAATGLNRVKCWGVNYAGQLGLEDMDSRGDMPGQMGNDLPFVNLGKGINVTQLSVGGEHNCVLVADSAGKAHVKCWGSAEMGQVGYGDTTYRGDVNGTMGDNLPYVELGTGLTATRVVTGQYATCAFLTPGTAVGPTIKCWGSAEGGQLGTGDEERRGDAPDEMGDNLPALDLGSGLAVLNISLGLGHGCASLANASTGQRLVKCWGANDYGELGLGDEDPRGAAPDQMGDNLPAVGLGTGLTPAEVSCNGYYSCAVLQSGTGPFVLKCWGENNAGQLGLGDEDARGDEPNEMGTALPAVPITF
ncbi:hypothetical protein HXX76_000039 [Chlamydomonas incerta]|uniref:Uncharacterized protein n=1 Tax=Chlamydomonas incerta TaxID=51695 RepID=A0A836B296_CHLIN|nr:hypothetical protein HXX76_000039 [Chlamydomonas incerta]|eukprot:KAG2445417.1 hypothetical protein HXX76_000039 [Chlamydomonas incerta]